MGEIDLDAARQARLEAAGERSFVFRGESYALPPELSWEAVETVLSLETSGAAALPDALAKILGEEEWERFKAAKPSAADINALLGDLMVEYGLRSPSANGDGGGGEIDPKSPPSPE